MQTTKEELRMDAIVRQTFEQTLRTARARLWEASIAADDELHPSAESRGAELEESPQDPVTAVSARSELPAKHIEEIDAALVRLADGRYGTCLECGREIDIARLKLVPATRFCLRCAHRHPRERKVGGSQRHRRHLE